MNVKSKYFSPKIFLATVFLGLLFELSLGFAYAIFTSRAYNFENTFATGTWSIPGPSGASGPSGVSGETGPSGASGPSGVSGETGPSGVTGETGPSGASGPSGTSGPSGATGPSGGSVVNYGTSFQASGSPYVDAGAGVSFDTLSQHATWEIWVKPNSVTAGGDRTLLARWGSGISRSWKLFLFSYQDQSYISAYIFDPSDPNNISTQNAYFQNTFQPNSWYHIAFVYDGTGSTNADKLKLYVNGQLKTLTFNGSAPVIVTSLKIPLTESVRIGGSGLGEYFDGAVDNVSIWNISRSVSDIQGDYLNELNGNESGLVAYWKMNEGTGTTVADSTVNSNTGNFFNSPTWVGGYPQVVLNEMMPRPLIGGDWIEIYNRSNVNVDLNSWSFADSTSTIPVSLNGIINSGAFQSFNVSDRLNMSSDTIQLKDAGGYLMDVKSYPPPSTADDISIGRKPDGVGDWQSCTTSTEGATNNISC